MERNMKEIALDDLEGFLGGWVKLDDYVKIGAEEITGQSRWSTFFEQIVQQKSTDAYWLIAWSAGSTECQDDDFEPIITEVKPVQVTVTKFVPKDA
jgi:hypothetical protein